MGWYASGQPQDAAFTIGAEADNAITVTVQLKDVGGANFSGVTHVRAFLSDDDEGVAISGTAPATSVTASTGSIIIAQTAKLAFDIQTDADGKFALVITETGGDTWYLVVILPDGTQVVSGAITFAG